MKNIEEGFVHYASHSRVYEYGSDWTPVLFSCVNGGYNVYHKDHNFSKHGGGGYAEKVVGMVLAVEAGKQVEFLPEKALGVKHPDLQFDGQTWDVKYINDANCDTIRKYIRNGRKADNVIFCWSPSCNKVDLVKEATRRSLGRAVKGGGYIPDIYYLNNFRTLMALYKNSSEPLIGDSDVGAEGKGISANPSTSQM